LLIYQSEAGTITKGILTGFRAILPTGRKVKFTRWLAHHCAHVHYEMKRLGYDAINDEDAKELLWEYMLDLCASPPNGLHHQSVAAQQIEEVAQEIVSVHHEGE
jgi:hypothetical protein